MLKITIRSAYRSIDLQMIVSEGHLSKNRILDQFHFRIMKIVAHQLNLK